MDLEKRFCEIRNFLTQYQYLHELEVMERFPYPLPDPFQAWSEALLSLTDKDLIALECFGDTSKLENCVHNNLLVEYFKKAWQLATIPHLNVDTPDIPQKLSRKMSQKKIHEVATIRGFLKDKKMLNLIDVGSGAGHLSSILVHDRPIKSFCVDMNHEFQQQGLKKLKRWNPELLDKIEFVNFELQSEQLLPFDYDSANTLVLGLHSCGPLSTYLIENQAKTPQQHLLNFGCCYHKLTNEYNLSQLAQKSPLTFTNHALTMAAKCHRVFGLNEFNERARVKKFRYAFHFYSHEMLNKPFATLGNAKSSDYLGKFSDYVQKYYSNELDAIELDRFFSDDKTQSNIQIALNAGVIRSVLGRLIELYLLLDRAIFLQESGLKVELVEMFKRELSPRNIAIICG